MSTPSPADMQRALDDLRRFMERTPLLDISMPTSTVIAMFSALQIAIRSSAIKNHPDFTQIEMATHQLAQIISVTPAIEKVVQAGFRPNAPSTPPINLN